MPDNYILGMISDAFLSVGLPSRSNGISLLLFRGGKAQRPRSIRLGSQPLSYASTPLQTYKRFMF